MMKTRRENLLYPIVEEWMKRHFLCFGTGTNTGLRYSRVDVVGIKDIGGDLSGDLETIAIEVKRAGSFSAASGQAFGYKVYANRVYLADERDEPFSWEQIAIAGHLGIGLIEVRNGKCREVLSSPSYSPMPRMNLLVLDQLGFGRCQLCGQLFETGGRKRNYAKVRAGDHNVQSAIGKGIMFWNYEVANRKHKLGVRTARDTTYERRFICPECVQNLLAIPEKRIKGWFSDHIAESVRKLLAIQEKKIKSWFTDHQREG